MFKQKPGMIAIIIASEAWCWPWLLYECTCNFAGISSLHELLTNYVGKLNKILKTLFDVKFLFHPRLKIVSLPRNQIFKENKNSLNLNSKYTAKFVCFVLYEFVAFKSMSHNQPIPRSWNLDCQRELKLKVWFIQQKLKAMESWLSLRPQT